MLGKFWGPRRRTVLFCRIMSFIKQLFVCADNGTFSVDKWDCVVIIFIICGQLVSQKKSAQKFCLNKTGPLPGPVSLSINSGKNSD